MMISSVKLVQNKIYLIVHISLYTCIIDHNSDHMEDIDGSRRNGSVLFIVTSANVIVLPGSICRLVYCSIYCSWKWY